MLIHILSIQNIDPESNIIIKMWLFVYFSYIFHSWNHWDSVHVKLCDPKPSILRQFLQIRGRTYPETMIDVALPCVEIYHHLLCRYRFCSTKDLTICYHIAHGQFSYFHNFHSHVRHIAIYSFIFDTKNIKSLYTEVRRLTELALLDYFHPQVGTPKSRLFSL